MKRAGTKSVRRVVYGGAALGELVVEVLYGEVRIRPKGKRKAAETRLTWSALYHFGRARKAEGVGAE